MKYTIQNFYTLQRGIVKYHVVNQRGQTLAVCYSESTAKRVARGLRLEYENRERAKRLKL